MRKLLLTALVAFAFATLVALGLRESLRSAATTSGKPLPEALVVYCFHGNQQCRKCIKIEQLTRQVLEQSFADDLKEGRIVWQVVNFETPENAHFAEQYKIVSTCIVLAEGRPGRAAVAKNLQQRVWELVDDEAAFVAFMQSEIRGMLK